MTDFLIDATVGVVVGAIASIIYVIINIAITGEDDDGQAN